MAREETEDLERLALTMGEMLAREPGTKRPSRSATSMNTFRKAEVIAAVRGGLISMEEACIRYRLTTDWQRLADRHGTAGSQGDLDPALPPLVCAMISKSGRRAT